MKISNCSRIGFFCVVGALWCLSGCQDTTSSPPGLPAGAEGSPTVLQPDFGIPGDAPAADETGIQAARRVEQFTDEANGFNSMNPRMARDAGGNTYLVWEQCTLGDSCQKSSVMAALHNGVSWGDPVEVSRSADGSANATSPDVKVDSSGVAHIIWKDTGSIGSRPTDSDIIYRTWNGESAESFGEAQTVSAGVSLGCRDMVECAGVYDARIALAGDIPGVVFSSVGTVRHHEVYYATATNGAWSATQVSDGSNDVPAYGGVGARSPDIGTDFLGKVYIVWVNQVSASDSKIQYRTVGDSLGTIRTIASECGVNRVFDPKVAVDGDGTGHLVWAGQRVCGDISQGTSIYYTKMNGDGVQAPVSDLTGSGSLMGSINYSPAIALTTLEGDTKVSVAWSSPASIQGSGTDHDIVMTSFKDISNRGETRVVSEPEGAVNTSVAASYYPSLVSERSGVLACWQEKDTNEVSDFDITCTGMGW